jgi:hypothetical protein
MPNSQFKSPATLRADGTIQVTGTLAVAEPAGDVEFRFMIVQNDVVVEGRGTGRGAGGSWSGTTTPGQAQLDAGPALAVGLAFLSRKEPGRGLGYETLTWSEQIELER